MVPGFWDARLPESPRGLGPNLESSGSLGILAESPGVFLQLWARRAAVGMLYESRGDPESLRVSGCSRVSRKCFSPPGTARGSGSVLRVSGGGQVSRVSGAPGVSLRSFSEVFGGRSGTVRGNRSALGVSGAGPTLLGVSGRPGVFLETPAKNSKTSAGPTLPETLRHSGFAGVSRRSQNPL